MGKIKLALALIIFLMLLHPAGARDGEGMRVVPAQEILDKIERGEPVEYDHVIVEGDLDLSKVELPKRQIKRPNLRILGLSKTATLVLSPIKLSNSTIYGVIYFNNTMFNNYFDLSGSKLKNNAYFLGCVFNGDAKFEFSNFSHNVTFGFSDFSSDANFAFSYFSGTIDFDDAEFDGDVTFKNANFNGMVDFGLFSDFNGNVTFESSNFNEDVEIFASHFNRNATFENAGFNGDASFLGSDFNGFVTFENANFRKNAHFDGPFNNDANFRDATFNGIADFWGASFKGNADFREADINGTVFFWFSIFNSNVYFSDLIFNGDADFYSSAFNNSDFSSSQFNKLVSFNNCRFNGSTNFNSSRFKEDALFEGAVFDGPLYLTRAKYDRHYIRWNNIKELGYDDAAYLSLLENFKKLGYVEDYDACYYEYRRLHRDQPWSGRYHAMHPWVEWMLKRIDLGLQAFYGYGKKPIWPLLWSTGTILLFGLIWRRAGVDGGRGRSGIFERFSPGREKKGKMSLKEESRAILGAVLFSATLFLSGTRLFVDPPAMPKLEGRLAAHVRSFFIAERVLGAFFSILFFLAISGTIVR